MKKVPAIAASPLSSFFRNSSASAKRAAYCLAAAEAIDSQRRVLDEARSLREKQPGV